MFITGIKAGTDSFHEYRGRVIYAELRDNSDNLIVSATLEYILRAFFDRKAEIQNYKEALIRYFDFTDKMIKNVS